MSRSILSNRRTSSLGRAVLLCALSLAPTISTQTITLAQEASKATSSATSAATQFLSSLSADQKKIAQIPFQDARRLEWHFVPMETRKGLPLREMNDDQARLALAVLKSVMSDTGFKRATNIMSYEAILLELEGPGAAKRRDYKKYYIAIYGEPNDRSEWGISFEGHHLSLNFTLDRGVIVDSTPQFYGLNPAKLPKSFSVPSLNPIGGKNGFQEGGRLLASEEDAGIALMASLDAAQKSKAVFNSKCPEEILWAGEAQPKPSDPVGIPASDMNADQKKLLMTLLESFQATMPKEVVLARMNQISAAGLDTIHFGWAGTEDLSGQHYFRLQGPTFIAEFCNYQADSAGNFANHIHCVWRDLTGDFNLPVVAAAK
ncbi:MAG: DUF3500 domain-containing protein [Pirellula sp.]|jgi:hypothetical protein|nr:DUF3500 domain-containing protein [Pirellula sp.]